MRWIKMLWFRFLPTGQRAAVNAAADATDRKVDALQSHQERVLQALDRELELYRLTVTDQKGQHP